MGEPNMEGLSNLIDAAADVSPIRVAVVNAAQSSVLESLRDAKMQGLVEPILIGDPDAIMAISHDIDLAVERSSIIPADGDAVAAANAVRLVRDGAADTIMKGNIHTDTFMRALLAEDLGLRLPGQRVSHAFAVDIPAYPKLLIITDAAINIAPDLTAKAQILQNAVAVSRLLGVKIPKVAALSAVETVTPAITSTLDAACLTMMARRGQITDCIVDGPLAFDNAISIAAALEKGIDSKVAGDADIVLVPDLVSGNILAKNLVYLAGATAAGIVIGLAAPVVLSSRADPPSARLAALALASLMHHRYAKSTVIKAIAPESSLHCAPQFEHACCPISG